MIKPGKIIEVPSKENGWCYVIETSSGGIYNLRGLGAPMGGEVGDQGTLKYQTGASFGLWMWEPSRSRSN